MSSAFVTAKSILVSYNPGIKTGENGKKLRGTSHEFQDYAYRLASQLRDLEHLTIYMKLAKKYPRYILESAYSSIADIDADSKGGLFMWKLKQIRLEIEVDQWRKTFDQEFIDSKSSKLRDRLADSLIKKSESEIDEIAKLLQNANISNLDKTKRSLIWGGSSLFLNEFLKSFGTKIEGLDLSKKIAKINKEKLKLNFKSKDLLTKKYKDGYFDYIFAYKSFDLICLESEQNCFKKLKQLIKPEGKIFMILSNLAENESQSWKELILGEETTYYFYKQNNIANLTEKANAAGLSLVNSVNLGKLNLLELQII